MREQPQNEFLSNPESNWSRALERGRLQGAMSEGLNLPGPGAVAAAATAIKVPGVSGPAAPGAKESAPGADAALEMAKKVFGPNKLIGPAYAMLFVEPFTSIACLMALLVWVTAAHIWPRPKWLPKFSILEGLATFLLASLFAAVILILVVLIASLVSLVTG